MDKFDSVQKLLEFYLLLVNPFQVGPRSMNLNLEIVRQFALANAHLQWHTEKQGKPFTLQVHDGKITFSISTGNERYLTDGDIVRICKAYNDSRSLRPRDYQGITYNSSYILAVFQLLLDDSTSQPTIAVDLDNPPPERAHAWVTRVVRNTALADKIKALHSHYCQICGETIALPNGGAYAEAHHIKPLGGKHLGPDIGENILCLCPNCHAKCDLGTIAISLPDLRIVDGHQVASEFLSYHNAKIFTGSESPGR